MPFFFLHVFKLFLWDMLGSHMHSSISFLGEGELLLKLNEDLESDNGIHGKKLDNLEK